MNVLETCHQCVWESKERVTGTSTGDHPVTNKIRVNLQPCRPMSLRSLIL
jgi:hypothetical protein